MDPSFSPNENYPFLSQFLFSENYENQWDYRDALLTELEKVWQRDKISSKQSNEYLNVRENVFAEVILQYYQEQYKDLVEESLHEKNSFEILFKKNFVPCSRPPPTPAVLTCIFLIYYNKYN